MRTLVLVVACSACGRVGFDPSADAPGSGTADAATDDAAPADAAVDFCASLAFPVVFCDDFASNTSARWDGHGNDGAPAVTANTLAVSTAAVATGDQTSQFFFKDALPAPTASAQLDFAFTIETLGTSEPVLAELVFDDGTNSHRLEYVYRHPPMQSYVEDALTVGANPTMFQTFPFTGPDGTSGWHTASLVYLPPTNTLQVRVDGTLVLDTPAMFTTTGAASIANGITFLAGPADPWILREDNIDLQIH